MSDIVKMRELIHPQAIVKQFQDPYGKNEVELVEDKNPSSKIRIAGIPDNSLIINLDDYFCEPDQIFAGNKNECCRADYILISANGNDRQIVFIELKGTDDDNSHIRKQLLGAECFSLYCASILGVFWKYKIPLNQYRKHFVCCKYTCSAARSTAYDPQASSNDTVDKMLILVGSHTFQYNQFIARKPK